MKRVTVVDNVFGHSVGWDPDGSTIFFIIAEPAVNSLDGSFVTLWIRHASGNIFNCQVVGQANPEDNYLFGCEFAPLNGSELHYLVENLPEHIIS